MPCAEGWLEDNCTEETAQLETCENQESENDTDTCTPFCACACCRVPLSSIHTLNQSATEPLLEPFLTEVSTNGTVVFFEIWEPPKSRLSTT